MFSVLNIFVIFDVFQDPGNVVFDFGENLKIEINFLQKCCFVLIWNEFFWILPGAKISQYLNYRHDFDPIHRCTEIGYLGWVLGILAKLFRGGFFEAVRKSRCVPFFVFYCIFMWQFFGPYPLPPPPLPGSLTKYLNLRFCGIARLWTKRVNPFQIKRTG